jgi:hypothetical protein
MGAMSGTPASVRLWRRTEGLQVKGINYLVGARNPLHRTVTGLTY